MRYSLGFIVLQQGYSMVDAPKEPRSFVTHEGRFHADEVTACALLLLFDLIDRDKIVRTRDRKLFDTKEFVCDVGGVYDPSSKRFDHHQAEYEGPLSSAGMILLYLKQTEIIDESLYYHLYGTLVKGVDLFDNGLETLSPHITTFSHIISQFSPIDYSPPKRVEDEAFFQALDFAVEHIRRIKNRYFYVLSCKAEVEEAMRQEGPCLFFDKGIPWIETFFDNGGEKHKAMFVIMPAGNHWKLRGIPPSLKERMKVRKPLPKSWAGLLEEQLQEVSGIPGAIFCHKGRFISIWQTRQDAERALEKTLQSIGNH